MRWALLHWRSRQCFQRPLNRAQAPAGLTYGSSIKRRWSFYVLLTYPVRAVVVQVLAISPLALPSRTRITKRNQLKIMTGKSPSLAKIRSFNMIAKRVIAKVTAQNIYNTEQGVYEAAASVNNDGELMVTFKPRTPPDAERPK